MGSSLLGTDWLNHNAADILAKEYDSASYIINGVLQKGIVGLIAGDGGVGKTSFCTQLAASIATDINFLDDNCEVSRFGKVVYFQHEEDDKLKAMKLKSLIKWYHHKFTGNDMDSVDRDMNQYLKENYKSPDIRGKNVCLVSRNSDGTYCPSKVFTEILSELEKLEDLELVIFDPLQSFYASDEMDQACAAFFMHLLDEIAVKTGATVLAVTHVSQASQVGQSRNPFHQSAVRGATAFVNAARWVLNLAKPSAADVASVKSGVSKDACLLCRVSKSNYTHRDTSFLFLREDDGFLSNAQDDGGYTEFSRLALDCVKDHPGEFTKTTFANGTGKEIGNKLGISGNDVSRFVGRMIEDGTVGTVERKNGKRAYQYLVPGGQEDISPGRHSAKCLKCLPTPESLPIQ